MQPHLNCEISPSRYFNHVSIEHDREYFLHFIDFFKSNFYLEFIARGILNDVFVLADEVGLASSQAINAETSNHDSPVRSECNSIPVIWIVAPSAR
jgi:hypothetical protein